MRLFLVCLVPLPLVAQNVVRYDVSVPAPATRLFHVKADFPTGGKDTLYLSLPAWSPGNYEIQNYARFTRHFAAHAASGQSLFWDRFDKDTWRVTTGKADRVTVEFDYFADTIDLSMARLRDDFGQFLGTNLFLYEEGQLARPAEVRFALPPGWTVTTALPGSGMGPYTAPDYHELVDAETFVGHYSLDSVQVSGKWLRLAMWPASDYTTAVAQAMRASITKIATYQDQLMGGAPYPEYTIFFNVMHQPVNFGGGLEHAASQFDIMPAGDDFADAAGRLGPFMRPLLAHESFHLWNVKRIRPAEMWPYDYHGEQYTPLLWWSEGVTDYYADLTNLRSGLWSDAEFLGNVAQNIDQVQSAPEPWSEEDGSVATWINEVYVNSSQLYYPKGSLTGLLLDLSIRDATDNAHSLDDVVRALYARFYQKGNGFRTADLLALFKEFGLPAPETFYQRFINGRDPLPYDSVFAKAGMVLSRDTDTQPFLGAFSQPTADGEEVQGVLPDSPAADAGLEVGDILQRIGDVVVNSGDWADQFRSAYRGKAGTPIDVTVQRAGTTVVLHMKVRERTNTTYRVTRAANPTARQAKIWRGLSTGSTGP